MKIILNSQDRTSGNPSDYNINVSSIHRQTKNSRIALEHVLIPLTFYYISEQNENKGFVATFSDNSTKEIWYSPNTLTNNQGSPSLSNAIAHIISQLNVNTSGQTFTCTLDPETGLVTFTSDEAYTFSFTTYPEAKTVLGFTTSSVSGTLSSGVYYASSAQCCNITPTQYLLLQLSVGKLDTSYESQNKQCDIFEYIPVLNTSFSNLEYAPHNLEWRTLHGELPGEIRVRLMDSNKKILNLNGNNYTIILRCESLQS